MALILNLETATTVCSVSIGKDGKSIASREINNGYTHAENLTVFIDESLKEAGIKIKDLDAVAVSKGPGSYTGLRIGVSVAKGLCYALDKPLIGVNTLENLTLALCKRDDLFLCPMLDARRMEVYCAIYDHDLKEIKPTTAEIISENSFSDLLQKNKIMFFGDGAEKCKTIISHPNALFAKDIIMPSAINMCSLSENAFRENKFEDLAYFEPYYLKDFVGQGKKSP
jgi:tRNA threonylcarbamoyladenosine biosynthesis protein TsaB